VVAGSAFMAFSGAHGGGLSVSGLALGVGHLPNRRRRLILSLCARAETAGAL